MSKESASSCEAVALALSAAETPGFDPYDGLSGTRVPAWVRSRRSRQVVVQLRKRVPVLVDGVFGITPRRFAKADGAFLSAASRCVHAQSGALDGGAVSDIARRRLISKDARMADGAWGYEFDVQTRWAFYPAGSPNLIATVFVARGLGTAGIALDDVALVGEMAKSAEFLRSQLLGESEPSYFRYTLTSDRLVHNANLLGAGLCGMAGALGGQDDLVGISTACAMTSVGAQRADGSWLYGEGASLGWADNFHTAYNLDGLLQIWLATGDSAVRASLDRGVEHWVRDFFGPAGEPKYYPNNAYPYDIHSAGTAVDVAARLATWGWHTAGLAERVAAWTKMNLVDSSTGRVYYQKHRLWTDKRYFVRWGAAHWALGQSSLALLREGRRDPLEEAVTSKSGVVSREG